MEHLNSGVGQSMAVVDVNEFEPRRGPGVLARSAIRPVMAVAESNFLLGRSRRQRYLLSLCKEGRSKTRGSKDQVQFHHCGRY
jgi:hypothetical protein